MPSLRDEIESLRIHPQVSTDTNPLGDCEQAWNDALDDVLAIVDKHEAKSKACKIHEGDHSLDDRKWCCTHLQWDCGESKPSDERPAREAIARLAGDLYDATGQLVESRDRAWCGVATYAIVEAIDALTSAVKAGKQ